MLFNFEMNEQKFLHEILLHGYSILIFNIYGCLTAPSNWLLNIGCGCYNNNYRNKCLCISWE